MSIAVVGDTLLDVDLAGSADRLSPDAPVPVVAVGAPTRRPGGAGLVAAMLAADGVEVDLVTAIADTERGAELREVLEAASGGLGGRIRLVAGTSTDTPVKTRVTAGGQVVARLDESQRHPAVPHATTAMLEAIRRADAVVVADYGRRLAESAAVRGALATAATRVPVVWDPHRSGAAPVRGCAVVTPNRSEADALSGASVDGAAGAAAAGRELLGAWQARSVAVTLGAEGAVLVTGDRPPHVVPAAEIVGADPCGAGDRLAASLARRLAARERLVDALSGAVVDVSAFLARGGVARVLETPATDLRPSGRDAVGLAHRVRSAGGRVIATGGCFDLLHAGHARTLAAARALGDCLIVCLNDDASVSRLKGPQRPIMSVEDRVDLLLALECVDAVVVFAEDTPVDVLRRIEPDVWVKGGDYRAEDLPETAVLAQWGGRTVTVPYVPGRSTTELAHALWLVG